MSERNIMNLLASCMTAISSFPWDRNPDAVGSRLASCDEDRGIRAAMGTDGMCLWQLMARSQPSGTAAGSQDVMMQAKLARVGS